MRIQLEQIRDRPIHWQEAIELTSEAMGLAGVVAPVVVDVDGQVASVDGDFLVTMTLDANLSLRCDRCLDDFHSPFNTRLESLLVVEQDRAIEGEVELEERDLGVVLLEEPEFDTEVLVFDQVQLAVPMSPRCRDNCAGLCSQCGSNQNREQCDCEPPVDPRWQVLAGRLKAPAVD